MSDFQFLKEPEEISSPVRWLRRHQASLAFLGAILVFVTLIVRDGMKERLKTLADSVDQAENVFALRNDIHRLEKYVRKRDSDALLFSGNLIATDEPEFFREWGNSLLDILDSDGMLRENNLRLIEQLEDNTDTRKSKKQIDEVEERRLGLRQEVEDINNAELEIDPRRPADPFHKHMHKLANAWDDTERLQYDMDALSAQILKQAQQLKAKTENRYKTATYASYVLYILGWGLALIGRLAGVNVSGDE